MSPSAPSASAASLGVEPSSAFTRSVGGLSVALPNVANPDPDDVSTLSKAGGRVERKYSMGAQLGGSIPEIPSTAIDIQPKEEFSVSVDRRVSKIFADLQGWIAKQKLSRMDVVKKVACTGMFYACTTAASVFAIRAIFDFADEWRVSGAAGSTICSFYFRNKSLTIAARQLREKNKLYKCLLKECENALINVYREYIADTRFEGKYSQKELMLLNHMDGGEAEKAKQADQRKTWKEYVYHRRTKQRLFQKKIDLIMSATKRFNFSEEQTEELATLFHDSQTIWTKLHPDSADQRILKVYKGMRKKVEREIQEEIRKAKIVKSGNVIDFGDLEDIHIVEEGRGIGRGNRRAKSSPAFTSHKA